MLQIIWELAIAFTKLLIFYNKKTILKFLESTLCVKRLFTRPVAKVG